MGGLGSETPVEHTRYGCTMVGRLVQNQYDKGK